MTSKSSAKQRPPNGHFGVCIIRVIGVSRVLYGSDAPIKGNYPADALQQWHRLPLTPPEFRTIETNVAPFLQPVVLHSRGDCGKSSKLSMTERDTS